MFLLVGLCFDTVSANFAKSKIKISFHSSQISPSILEFCNTFSRIDSVSLIFHVIFNYWFSTFLN